MTNEEEMALRELAAGQCTIQKVVAQIGPLSLWSKSGLEAEIRKAVEAEREACAKVCEVHGSMARHSVWMAEECAALIRARGDSEAA